jgi:hypothetical protein
MIAMHQGIMIGLRRKRGKMVPCFGINARSQADRQAAMT